MGKKDLVIKLQANLMELARVFIDKRGGYNKLSDVEKNEFSYYNERFKELINKLPTDFYFDETDSRYVDEIIELSDNITSKTETYIT